LTTADRGLLLHRLPACACRMEEDKPIAHIAELAS
jgi:hypothetical protein